MLEIKNTVRETKNACNGFISTMDTAKESVSLKKCQQKTSKTERQREKKSENSERNIQELWNNDTMPWIE